MVGRGAIESEKLYVDSGQHQKDRREEKGEVSLSESGLSPQISFQTLAKAFFSLHLLLNKRSYLYTFRAIK